MNFIAVFNILLLSLLFLFFKISLIDIGWVSRCKHHSVCISRISSSTTMIQCSYFFNTQLIVVNFIDA